MNAAHTPVSYDTAYPGSMVERKDGYFLRRDDHKSLAASLVELIASRDREIEDLRDGLEAYKRLLRNAPSMLDALRISQKLLENVTPCKGQEDILANAIAMNSEVIAKATGAQS